MHYNSNEQIKILMPEMAKADKQSRGTRKRMRQIIKI